MHTGLASCGVTCLNSSVVFQINFSAGLTVLCSEIPHERQAQKRCKQPLTNRTCKMKENIKIFGSYKLRVNSDILLPKKKAKHKEESKSRKRKNSKV